MFHVGVVENRDDPLKLGRCKVRVIGLHTHDKAVLKTEDLPWAVQNIPNSASMNGIGESPTNLVEGTVVLVVFLDEHKQSPVIMGSLLGIPQTNSKIIDTLNDEYDSSVDNGIPDTTSTNPVSEAPDSIDPNVIDSTPDSNPGIAALNKAMEEAGITSKFARASILGICKVESNFKCVAENLNYSAEALLATFPSVFKNDKNLAKSVERRPKNIAEMVYGPVYGKGKELGNDVVGDGWKYRGRGYVQLTGKANYRKYSAVAGVDLVSNPDLMLDEDIASKVTVQYFKDRVKLQQDNPSYINDAIKAVGLNRADIREKKFNAYQYYMGESSPLDQTDKSTDIGKSSEQHKSTAKINGVPIDRVSNLNFGFSDPNFKYPLKEYIGEPDTNRLARGRYNGTIAEKKDKNRVRNIPTSIGTSWTQPISPFNSQYPYNKVIETESGHVQEFDDTPGNERIHRYHRKGTFEEIDVNGTKVTRIVGDNYEIIDRNGFVYVAGDVHITAAGDINVLSQSNANIKVHGDSNINIHGDANLNIGGDMKSNVSGDFKLKASNIILESDDRFDAKAGGKMAFDSERLDFNDDQAKSSGLGSGISSLKTVNPNYSQLKTPPRKADEEFIFETPEDVAEANLPPIEDAMPEKQENEVVQPRKTPVKPVAPSCDIYYNMEDFPKTLILHTDATGYDWTLGKLLNGNELKAITVKGKRYEKADIVCNLKGLAENILGKLNETIGPIGSAWLMTSCYRSGVPSGGSKTSQHLIGQAVDFVIGHNFNYDTTYSWAKQLSESLPFDQFLYEFLDSNDGRKNWLHISYSPSGGRKQVLTFLNHSTNTTGLRKLA